ncbi:MAG: TAXI family TRAP transporter solute-binding subunit [Chloroflexi bacterium]|nr:TAXI family TRAP transporter solute-binding subunit [Chloroflexota bacterium]
MRSICWGLVVSAVVLGAALVACAAPAAAPAPAKEAPKAAAPAQEAAKPAAPSQAPAAQPAKPAVQPPKPAAPAPQPAAKPAARAGWPTRITIGGGDPGTAFYAVATGWAKVIQDKLGIPTNVIAAGGSQSNLQSVQSGEATFALSSMNNIHEGLTGTRWAQGKKTDKVRVVLPTFVQYLHFFALKESNIKTLKDFDGKVFSPGPGGTQLPIYVKDLFDAVGVKPSRIITGPPWPQIADLVKDKQVTGLGVIGGPPLTPIAQVNLTHPLFIFGPSEEERDKIIKALPFFFKNDMSKDFYKDILAQNVPALSVYVAFHGSKDLPEDFVYEVLKVTYPNVPEIAKAHRSGAEIAVNAAANITNPFHKGAAKYVQEQGIKIQDAGKPID